MKVNGEDEKKSFTGLCAMSEKLKKNVIFIKIKWFKELSRLYTLQDISL